MNETIVIYGSSTGTCEAIAEKIAQKLGYDICAQCERYCERKGKCKKCQHAQ